MLRPPCRSDGESFPTWNFFNPPTTLFQSVCFSEARERHRLAAETRRQQQLAEVEQHGTGEVEEEVEEQQLEGGNPVGDLQERAQRAGRGLPVYTLGAETGEPHQPMFEVRVEYDTHTSIGRARTKREAKRQAAAGLLAILQQSWAEQVEEADATGEGAGGGAAPVAQSSPRPLPETPRPVRELEAGIRKEDSRHYFNRRQEEKAFQQQKRERLRELEVARKAEEDRRRAERRAIVEENDRQALLRMQERERQEAARQEQAALEAAALEAAASEGVDQEIFLAAGTEEIQTVEEEEAPAPMQGEAQLQQQAGEGAGAGAAPVAQLPSRPQAEIEIVINLVMSSGGLVGLRVRRMDGVLSAVSPAPFVLGRGSLSIVGELAAIRDLFSPDSAADLRGLLMQDPLPLPDPVPAITPTTFVSMDNRFPPPSTGWNYAQHVRFGFPGFYGDQAGAAGPPGGLLANDQWHHIHLNTRLAMVAAAGLDWGTALAYWQTVVRLVAQDRQLFWRRNSSAQKMLRALVTTVGGGARALLGLGRLSEVETWLHPAEQAGLAVGVGWAHLAAGLRLTREGQHEAAATRYQVASQWAGEVGGPADAFHRHAQALHHQLDGLAPRVAWITAAAERRDRQLQCDLPLGPGAALLGIVPDTPHPVVSKLAVSS